MANRKILIVDDSEIDREVLRNILSADFEIMEADNGYSGLSLILAKSHELSAVMLDISMPIMDGFNVLYLMRENGIDNLPIFLITAEARPDNVQRAAQFNVSEFIRKPFNSEEILRRLKLKLNMVYDDGDETDAGDMLTEADIFATTEYIKELEKIYHSYLKSINEDNAHYVRVSDLMRILLYEYAKLTEDKNMDDTRIEFISKAAYFCDIGGMAVGNAIMRAHNRGEQEELIYQNHTHLGADIVRLNHARRCAYFVQICSDICLHHHERYDGKGFPHRLIGNNNSIYSQMCRMLAEFDILFFKYMEHNARQFEIVINEMSKDQGALNPVIFMLLTSCRDDIMAYYSYLK